MDSKTFAPCLICSENGYEFDKNSERCQQCNYYIIVSCLSQFVYENTDCRYCFNKGKNCVDCDYKFDVNAFIEDNRKQKEDLEVSDSDEGINIIIDDSYFERDRNRMLDDQIAEVFLDNFSAWLEDEDDEWQEEI